LNIVKSGVKQHNPNPNHLVSNYFRIGPVGCCNSKNKLHIHWHRDCSRIWIADCYFNLDRYTSG